MWTFDAQMRATDFRACSGTVRVSIRVVCSLVVERGIKIVVWRDFGVTKVNLHDREQVG